MSIQLPMELNHVFHKNGGRILRVTNFLHEEAKPKDGRSRDIWHFIGDVEWSDGGTSTDLEIAPWAVCYRDENNREEVDQLMRHMNDYQANTANGAIQIQSMKAGTRTANRKRNNPHSEAVEMSNEDAKLIPVLKAAIAGLERHPSEVEELALQLHNITSAAQALAAKYGIPVTNGIVQAP